MVRLNSKLSSLDLSSSMDTVLCSWARHLAQCSFYQVYKWVPANLMLGVTLRWISIPSTEGGIEILLQKPGYMLQLVLDHLAPMQNFPTYARAADIN